MDNNSNNNGGNNRQPKKPNYFMVVLAMTLTMGMAYLFYSSAFSSDKTGETKEYTHFLEDLKADKVESVKVGESGKLTVTLKAPEGESQDTNNNPFLNQIKQSNRTYTTMLM